MDPSNFRVLGSDGTNANVGNKGGVICLIEKELKRALQWAICLLHNNELPLRHLIETLDGGTKGPNAFSGPIGSALHTCHTLAVVNFEPISTNVEIQIGEIKDLSNDQLYLLEIVYAVAEGSCSEELGKKTPGKVAHSRCLTTASRVLRLYVSTEMPSNNLKVLATCRWKESSQQLCNSAAKLRASPIMTVLWFEFLTA
ncbi:unnamed protein product [Bemisia tabaci]|uniref:Uncharacterized protein n=1 Tax=Bemisia tabaci TaxID=7038 RepID=A0A9P0F1V7_BEMTA|nr:unnamed protein product [Bemisia tabaci]